MFSYHNFDEVFAFNPECSYEDESIHNIGINRSKLEGLFIEKVMKLMGIKRPTKYYPPKTNGDLKNLHKTVVESTAADHHKISVLYYLLLEFDYPTGKRQYSTVFERKSFLPPKYSIYMKGLWHMDRQEFEDALQYLTHPSLIPTFADEILEVLVKRSKDLTLPLAYYHTIRPTLTSKIAIEHVFSAIARTNVTEAFYFSRGQPEHTRKHMFEMLVAIVLNNSPKDTIADRSVELVNLPLSSEEDIWLEEYLLRGEGRQLPGCKDTVMMRKIGTGDFAESLSLRKRVNTHQVGGLDWKILAEAVQGGLGPRVDV